MAANQRAAPSFLVTIQARSGGGFLSCFQDGANNAVDTWGIDDASGRQRWVLTPSGLGPNSYVITVSGGRPAGAFDTLSVSAAGKVDLWSHDDGSGRQRWLVLPVVAKTRTFSLSIENGLLDIAHKFLTVTKNGGVVGALTPHTGAAAQLFRVLEVPQTVPRRPGVVSLPVLPRVFVGGAYPQALSDLTNDPAGWADVAPRAGYWLHPMGFDAIRSSLPRFLSLFGTDTFAYEMDLNGWSDGSNPVQTNTPSFWADQLKAIDPSFECAFYAPWVYGDALVTSTADVVDKYTQIRTRMDAAGYANKGFFFYSPPCPQSIANVDALLSATGGGGGKSFVEHVVIAAGLKGICLDFPANLYLSSEYPAPQFPIGTAEKCRRLAKQAHDIARRLGIAFVWVFDGADADVAGALTAIRAAGMTLDASSIDSFADAGRRGTPETDPNTLAGQAMHVLSSSS